MKIIFTIPSLISWDHSWVGRKGEYLQSGPVQASLPDSKTTQSCLSLSLPDQAWQRGPEKSDMVIIMHRFSLLNIYLVPCLSNLKTTPPRSTTSERWPGCKSFPLVSPHIYDWGPLGGCFFNLLFLKGLSSTGRTLLRRGMLGWGVAPKSYVHVLIPRTLWMWPHLKKRMSADLIKLKILRWWDYLPCIIWGNSKSNDKFHRRKAERNLT